MPDVPRELESRVIEAQIELLRLDAGTRRKVMRVLEALRKELEAALIAADPSGVVRTDFQRRRLEVLMGQVDDLLRGRYREIAALLRDDMAGIGTHSAGVAATLVNATVAANVIEPVIGSADIRRMVSETVLDGGALDEWLEQQAGRLRMRFLREVRMGMLAQEPVAKIAQRIRGTGGHSGVVTASRREALALARGAVISIANKARIEAYFSSSAVRGLQWLATLDTRTCPECSALDGKTWDRDLKPIKHKFAFPGPISHLACRCTTVPLMKDWDELVKSKKLADALRKFEGDSATRASMGGQVPATLTYEQWLRKQSEETQRRVLGPGRLSLWRSGQIGIDDMVDQTGRPLTLDDLRG